ncbi:MAG: hypothetical protein DME25_00190 [Verrucomicrobia bacterium]|nr:MAG: hypothetical protein DME25_00190 [Verrucomicrobiota bacterium]
MKEYDVFIPLYYNDGKPVEASKFQDLQSRLLEQFEGLTYFPQPNKGFWKFGDMSYQDEIVIYRVISQDPAGARDFLVKLKAWLREQFKQKEILIIEREIGVL